MSFPVWSRRNKGNFELLEAEILTFIAFHCHAPEKVSRLIFEQKAQQVLNLTASESIAGRVASTSGMGEFATAVALFHQMDYFCTEAKVAMHTILLSGV